jgi:DNA mismatch repair protein MutL
MADLIQLLPDSIANKIAAGEVVQRPASVVKELMENAIDAGATEIKLIVKEAGKSLIQVIDNGCGMSETDARMSFERHATSKIREAEDLFAIRTMGFRGEALASIAAVAQVEMKTRQHGQELGTRIVVEGAELKTQEPCQTAEGTSLSVKNLFYNIPARRNFLRSNSVELRHIMDEFQRIALSHPDLFFSLHHNGEEMHHLPPGNLRQRVVNILKGDPNKKLVPVSEETDILKIHGFVGKPEFARKTRGDQFFFVNNRYIKSGYLNHAVVNAYEELLPKETYPLYVLFIDIDPARIDINVHPTKQEIKFDDERLVYNYLKGSIRHALGQYSITPSLDFDQEVAFTERHLQASRSRQLPPETDFSQSSGSGGGSNRELESPNQSNNLKNWQKLYEGLDAFEWTPEDDSGDVTTSEEGEEGGAVTIQSQWSAAPELDAPDQSFSKEQKIPYQLHRSYIVSPIKSGYLLVDQQHAHERILYEEFLRRLEEQEHLTQKELFPRTIELPTAEAELLKQMLVEVNQLGFDIKEFGQDSFVIHGLPAELVGAQDEQAIIEELLDQFKINTELRLSTRDNLARSLARSASIKRGQVLGVAEMQGLIDKLFACTMPQSSPSGKRCFITYTLDDLEKQFSS